MRCFQAVIVAMGMFCMAADVHAEAVSVGDDIVLNGGGEEFKPASETGDWDRPTNWTQTWGNLGTFNGGQPFGSYRLTCWGGTHSDAEQVFYNAMGFDSNVGSLSLSAYVRHEGTGIVNDYRSSQIKIIAGYSADGSTLTDLQNTLSIISAQDETGWENVKGSIPVLHGATPTNYVKIILLSLSSDETQWSSGSNFDNVSLTATQAIPEPTTLVLTVIGVVGLLCHACLRRRRGG